MHPIIARLNGRGAPREDILDRLQRMNPRYRVSWIPPGAPQKRSDGSEYTRPAAWRIYEFREDPLRRAAGAARLARFERRSQAKQAANPGIVYECFEMIDGCHLVTEYADDVFGTDAMFDDLQRYEKEIAQYRDDIDAAQAKVDADQVMAELDANEQFRELVRETAGDFYRKATGNIAVPVTATIQE